MRSNFAAAAAVRRLGATGREHGVSPKEAPKETSTTPENFVLVVRRLAEVLASETHDVEARPYVVAAVLNRHPPGRLLRELPSGRRQGGGQDWSTAHPERVTVKDVKDAASAYRRWLTGELRWVGSGFQPAVQDALFARGYPGYRKTADQVRSSWGCTFVRKGSWEFCKKGA